MKYYSYLQRIHEKSLLAKKNKTRLDLADQIIMAMQLYAVYGFRRRTVAAEVTAMIEAERKYRTAEQLVDGLIALKNAVATKPGGDYEHMLAAVFLLVQSNHNKLAAKLGNVKVSLLPAVGPVPLRELINIANTQLPKQKYEIYYLRALALFKDNYNQIEIIEAILNEYLTGGYHILGWSSRHHQMEVAGLVTELHHGRINLNSVLAKLAELAVKAKHHGDLKQALAAIYYVLSPEQRSYLAHTTVDLGSGGKTLATHFPCLEVIWPGVAKTPIALAVAQPQPKAEDESFIRSATEMRLTAADAAVNEGVRSVEKSIPAAYTQLTIQETERGTGQALDRTRLVVKVGVFAQGYDCLTSTQVQSREIGRRITELTTDEDVAKARPEIHRLARELVDFKELKRQHPDLWLQHACCLLTWEKLIDKNQGWTAELRQLERLAWVTNRH